MTTLVDTSVWIEHLGQGNDRLAESLNDGGVLCHRFVIGELACGRLRNRDELLSLLKALPAAPIAEHDEVLGFVATRRLFGRGLGWVDMHLLASALLAGCNLWTLDRPLAVVAAELGIG
ncbi:MAG TPA: type II toxin-antitoxin system VapC family toxin [Acidobacteriota bacterium]|nr:type II toxin-antitoxin system VapC family toxin [Acidobacteriota bacterium]